MVVSEPVSARAAIEPAPLSRAFAADCSLFARQQGSGGRSYDLSSLNVFVHCPSFTMETPRSIFRAPQQGQWLTSLSQRHLLAVHSTVIRVVNQSESISKILKPVLAIAHLHRVKIALVHRRLVVKPRDTPGSSRANILAQVPVPIGWVGFKPREVGSKSLLRLPRIWGSSWTPL